MVYFAIIFKFTVMLTMIIFAGSSAVMLWLRNLSQLRFYTFTMSAIIVLGLFLVDVSYSYKLIAQITFAAFYIISYFHLKGKFISEKALEESEEHYRNLVDNNPLAIIIHQEGVIVYANQLAVKLTQAKSRENLIGTLELDLIHPNYRIAEIERMERILKGEQFHSIEKKLITLNKEIIDVEVTNMLVTHKGAPAIICLFKDVTEKRKMENRIKDLAFHDSLTKLPNRYMLNNYINNALASPNKKNSQFAVMFIDLDNFKNINDSLGHNIGDLVLKYAANRLKSSIRESDLIARYGGDEFVIVLENISREEITLISKRMLAKFKNPFQVDEHELFISPSIGISFYPEDGSEIDNIIKNADVAMYVAKENGKNNYNFFTPELNNKILRKVELENGLRKALKNNEFILYYQPEIDLSTGDIYGVEALIRWNHPTLGMISPSEFIPLAEETGIINDIGEWVLENACRQNKLWQDLGLAKIPISINVSAIQLQSSEFVKKVEKYLDMTKLEPEYLIVEFTESILQNTENSSRIIDVLNSIGVKVAIDDFGTGYSSLSLLKNLNIDILKLDSHFIKDVDTNPNTLPIIKLIIDMSSTLNFCIITEGIETAHQARIMRESNCKVGQGYFFSKPLEASQAQTYLSNY
jgi:diguanylate cyclase (GGDEF)-like protein/PAS domain S-box-containing protein